jgi:hypothetical protein
MTTGLQRDVDGSTLYRTFTPVQGVDFGVLASEATMVTLADDAASPGNDAPNHGIGLDPATTPSGQSQSPFHEVKLLLSPDGHI